MNRKEKIIGILPELGLPLEILETIEQSNDAFNLPYHNQEHMYTVALRCYEAKVIQEKGVNPAKKG